MNVIVRGRLLKKSESKNEKIRRLKLQKGIHQFSSLSNRRTFDKCDSKQDIRTTKRRKDGNGEETF